MNDRLSTPDALCLSWAEPAREWAEATPLGNGRIGAMVYGGAHARYQINDSTLWSGTPDATQAELAAVVARGAGPERLLQVRHLLAAGDLDAASDLLMSFEGRYTQEFLPLVDLWVDLPGATPAPGVPARVLNLDQGYVEEYLDVEGIRVRRRTWASSPASALLIEITAEEPCFTTRLRLTSPLRVTRRGADSEDRVISESTEVSCGLLTLDVDTPIDGAPLHEKDVDPPHVWADEASEDQFFASATAVVRTDGQMSILDGEMLLGKARRVVIALSTATRAELWWEDPEGDKWRRVSREQISDRAMRVARAAAIQDTETSFTEHVRDFADASTARFMIGNRRNGVWDVQGILASDDPGLKATVAAEYGRYLLVASSRSGGPPANLQGIWNEELRPAWSSNYTININTEMNYWAAPVLGAIDSAESLISLVEKLARNGERTARELYGCRGWVAHHNTDFWGWSLPVGMGHGGPSWAIWMMGGVWLTHNLWDLWEVTGDKALLERIWPLMCGACEFLLDWLVEDETGCLITSPSTSPENQYLGPDGRPQALGLTATMDIALIRSLFERTLQAGEVLRQSPSTVSCDTPYSSLRSSTDSLTSAYQASLVYSQPASPSDNVRHQNRPSVSPVSLREALARLPEMEVGADGRLREWLCPSQRDTSDSSGHPATHNADHHVSCSDPHIPCPDPRMSCPDPQDAEPLHRHLSPLVGLYPLDLITPQSTPELAEGARRFLSARGPGAMGWSWAWKIALRARLGQGDIAHTLLAEALTPLTGELSHHAPVDGSVWGGLMPNLLSSHPPFQIDGNLGFPAAITELLVQSHAGVVRLLPALPTLWPMGEVTGLRIRGGLALDLRWADNCLQQVLLTNLTNEERVCCVAYGDRTRDLTLPAYTTIWLGAELRTEGEHDYEEGRLQRRTTMRESHG